MVPRLSLTSLFLLEKVGQMESVLLSMFFFPQFSHISFSSDRIVSIIFVSFERNCLSCSTFPYVCSGASQLNGCVNQV